MILLDDVIEDYLEDEENSEESDVDVEGQT